MASEVPEGSVVITPAQVYDKVVTLTEQVTKLITQDEASERAAGEQAKKVVELEGRIRTLEQKVWVAAGFAAGAGGTLGSLISKLLS